MFYFQVMHYDGAPLFIGREDGAFAVVEFGQKKARESMPQMFPIWAPNVRSMFTECAMNTL
jgi:hypothetical protein